MSIYDRRDGPAYAASADPAYARNPHILAWWTSEHDAILGRQIKTLKRSWYGTIAGKIVSGTPPETLERWRAEDPFCATYAWYNVLMYFAIARADQLGLTQGIEPSKRRTCPLCDEQFDEDSLPESFVQRLGVDQLDFCAPCLTRVILRLRRQHLPSAAILDWARELTEVLQREPPQFFGERKDDLLGLTTAQRLRVLRLLEHAPTSLCVEREFGSWQNVLVEAGVRQARASRSARRHQQTRDPGQPTIVQLQAFLSTIDQPPSPWADEWFVETRKTETSSEQGSPAEPSTKVGTAEPSADLSPLGQALIEALLEAGEDPAEVIRRRTLDDSSPEVPRTLPAQESSTVVSLAEWSSMAAEQTLNRLLTEGGTANFAVVDGGDLYVQFSSARGYPDFYMEAVGNRYLPAERRLTSSQIEHLERLQFALDPEGGNFALQFNPDVRTAAQLSNTVLADVFGLAPSSSLNVRLHLGNA